MDTIILIILILIVLVIISIIARYNKIIKLQNRVKSSESGIDIYLNQRFDLIPNLVECVKGYAKHEKELLEKIVKQRTAYSQSKNLKNASELNNNMNRIIAVAENYPELKDDDSKLDVTFKVNNNTKYNMNFHGQDTYDAETIENSKGLMLYIRLDANTLNDEYPCISMFDSYSN